MSSLLSAVFAPADFQSWQRTDQGKDVQLKPGSPLHAIGPGFVTIAHNPGGFGTNYAVLHVTSGPYKGRAFYYGHSPPTVGNGAKVNAGDVIARTGTRVDVAAGRTGNATSPGWLEFGTWPPPAMGAGGPAASILQGVEHSSGAIGALASGSAGTTSSGPSTNPVNYLPIPGQPGPLGAALGLPSVGDAVGVGDPVTAIAKGIVDAIASALGINGAKIGLTLLLVAAGVTLAVLGTGRAAGVTGGDVRKAAETGAKVGELAAA